MKVAYTNPHHIRPIPELADQGFRLAVIRRVLESAPLPYCYEAIKREPAAPEIEDYDLTGLIVEVHHDSRGI